MTTSTGHPTARTVVAEAWAAARARPLSTLTTALVVALVCLVTLATTGRTAATEHQVLSTVDSLGTRLITVTDATGTAGVDPSVVAVLENQEGIEWAFALGPAEDATLPSIGATATGVPVAVRPLLGELPAEIGISGGRAARAGEALAGAGAARNLGLTSSAGQAAGSGSPVAIVGTFDVEGPLGGLADLVLVRPLAPEHVTVRYVYVRAAPGYDVESVADLVEALVPSATPAAVNVEVAQGALKLRSVLSGALGESSRALMATILGVGLLLVAITVTGSVNARRRDFGRQRAIGASRSAIVTLVVLSSAIAGALGALVGSLVGVVATSAMFGQVPSAGFVVSLVALSLLVAVLGAVPPAVAAARRDPVRILRVP